MTFYKSGMKKNRPQSVLSIVPSSKDAIDPKQEEKSSLGCFGELRLVQANQFSNEK